MSELASLHITAVCRLRRLIRKKLLIPLLRLRHQPELAARGTMVGLAWAFTPTFGIRMPLVLLTWLATRHLLRWDFSLILGLAWTWATNIVVLGPLYFLFYCTGCLLRGMDPGMADPGSFSGTLGEWGFTLWLGALPWSLAMAALGYIGVHRFLGRRKARGRRG